MNVLRLLYYRITELLTTARMAPQSEYSRGYTTAIEDVHEMFDDIAWEEGIDVDGWQAGQDQQD